jgi:hypothetical protein
MSKDYQEITHKILANLELVLMDKSIDGSDVADIWERFKPTLEIILTTYGNAREIQGAENALNALEGGHDVLTLIGFIEHLKNKHDTK